MPNYISKIQLPGGGTYDIKDAEARQMIAGGVIGFVLAWTSDDWQSATVGEHIYDVPDGAIAYYNRGYASHQGELQPGPDTKGKFYLVYSNTRQSTGDYDTYDEYVTVQTGEGAQATYFWEKIGDTQFNFGGTDIVLGEGTTFTATGTAVTPTTTYLGASASGTAVGSTTKYLSASASGTAVGANGTASAVTGYSSTSSDTFVKSVNTSKLSTTTVPNVTAAGSASSWSFTMGTGTGNTETLIISGANGSAPTLGTAITVATGSVSSTGGGATVATGVPSSGGTASALTGLGTPSTSTVLTGVKVTTQPTITLTANDSTATGRITYLQALGTITQPTITLASNSSSATGRVQVATGISSVTQPTVSANTSSDPVTVITPAQS